MPTMADHGWSNAVVTAVGTCLVFLAGAVTRFCFGWRSARRRISEQQADNEHHLRTTIESHGEHLRVQPEEAGGSTLVCELAPCQPSVTAHV